MREDFPAGKHRGDGEEPRLGEGQELGRAWYEDGKLLHKMNTFTDFIDCAEHLAATGWADRVRMFASGGSALKKSQTAAPPNSGQPCVLPS